MFHNANLSNQFRMSAHYIFNGFEPKTLLVGTTVFYVVSILLAAVYLTLDHPSIGQRIFSQQPTQSQHYRSPEFIPVYSTLTSDPSYTMQQISIVLADYDLTGVETTIQCRANSCSFGIRIHNTERASLVSEIKSRFNQTDSNLKR